MTPLEALKRIRQETCPATICPDFDKEECCNIIENALKRLEMYENYGINLDETDDVEKTLELNARITIVDKVMDTQERLLASVSSDEIRILSSVLNSQIRKLKKKLKALEILKKYIHIEYDSYDDTDGYSKDCEYINVDIDKLNSETTKEEFKLLKEVLK